MQYYIISKLNCEQIRIYNILGNIELVFRFKVKKDKRLDIGDFYVKFPIFHIEDSACE